MANACPVLNTWKSNNLIIVRFESIMFSEERDSLEASYADKVSVHLCFPKSLAL